VLQPTNDAVVVQQMAQVPSGPPFDAQPEATQQAPSGSPFDAPNET